MAETLVLKAMAIDIAANSPVSVSSRWLVTFGE